VELHPYFLSYQPGESFLHRADARVKLLALILWQFLIWNSDLYGVLMLLALVALLHPLCHLSLRRALFTIRVVIFFALFALLAPLLASAIQEGIRATYNELYALLAINLRYALRLITTALLAGLWTTTSAIARWVDAIEFFLSAIKKIRAAVALLMMMTLNYITIIQRHHYQILRALQARMGGGRRRKLRVRASFLLHYCTMLLFTCARFAELSVIAISARKFSHARAAPTFDTSLRENLPLLFVTFFVAVLALIMHTML